MFPLDFLTYALYLTWILLAIRYFAYNRSRPSSVGIFGLCAGLPRNRGSISSKGKRLLLLPSRPGQEVKLKFHLHLVLRLKLRTAVSLFLHMPLWLGA